MLHDKTLKELATLTTIIYTDGSGIQGKVGAAIVKPATKIIQQIHLGSDVHYNVFTAEVRALAAAAETIKHDLKKDAIIFTDSQAAAKATSDPKKQSGQSFIKQYLDAVDKTRPLQVIKIIWIPGHEGIDENEQADEEVKKAALNAPDRNPQSRYNPLRSAIVAHIKKNAKSQWHQEWNKGTKTAVNLRRITR